MATSRVQKFKDYRNSLLKEDSPALETIKNTSVEIANSRYETTSTLPMAEVIDALNKEEEKEDLEEELALKKEKKKKILIYTLTIVGLLLLAGGIVVFAILVF